MAAARETPNGDAGTLRGMNFTAPTGASAVFTAPGVGALSFRRVRFHLRRGLPRPMGNYDHSETLRQAFEPEIVEQERLVADRTVHQI